MHRYIVHLDMDAFFASVEARDQPEFAGKPLVVGADPKEGRGRGVVSTCSYEARKFGIHSAMPISVAWRKCPTAIFLPVNFKLYETVSSQVFKILENFSPDIEPISIDESFVDISRSYKIFGTPLDTCKKIKETIKRETKLTASIGLAPVKMAAKIASDLAKPDGLLVVEMGRVREFLAPLDIRKLWGLGPKTEIVLRKKGIHTIGDIAKCEVDDLAKLVGNSAEHFWELANGIDPRPVESAGEAKSVGNEVTFDDDVWGQKEILRTIRELAEKVSSRLRDAGLRGRTITLKIRLESFETFTRAVTLRQATNFYDVILEEAQKLWRGFRPAGKKIRLIGLRVNQFGESEEQIDFIDEAENTTKERRHKALDAIRHKHGNDSIHWAGTL